MDITFFCQSFNYSHHIPIIYYKNGTPIFQQGVPDCIAQISPKLEAYEKFKDPEIIYYAPYQAMFGIIPLKSKNEFLIIGPVYSINISDKIISLYYEQKPIEVSREDLFSFLHSLPKYTYNQLLNLIQFLYFVLTGTKVDLEAIQHQSDHQYSKFISQIHTAASYESHLNLTFHGTFNFEQLMIEHVKNGDVKALKNQLNLFAQQHSMTEGNLANEPLRQAKNIFIGNISIIGKQGAIKGGVDIEEIYQLIDIYIQECEKLNSIEEIMNLQYNMLIDMTERVALHRLPDNLSNDILKCVQYIEQHYSENITIDDLVKHTNISRSYLSTLFKREIGQSIINYITQLRINYAKTYLRFSSKSISEISEFLNFSNQSYFQNVFKKYTGVTPLSYRKQHRLIDP